LPGRLWSSEALPQRSLVVEHSPEHWLEVFYVRAKGFYVIHKKFLAICKTPCHAVGAMAIQINLDVMMARRKMSLTELSSRIGISMTNLSLLKTGKVKGIRFSTLEAICRELECQPGDILEYLPDYV
jgi:putative transcriptional regulator